MTSYQISNFSAIFECLSDYQAIHTDSKSLFIGSFKTILVLLVNYLIFNAFLEPRNQMKNQKEDVGNNIDCGIENDAKSNAEEPKEYDEYRPY